MTKASILTAIRTSGLSEAELLEINRELIEVIKRKRRSASPEAGNNLSVGDQVSWTSRRGSFTGTLEKINRKNGKVRLKGGFQIWTVPMSMLGKV